MAAIGTFLPLPGGPWMGEQLDICRFRVFHGRWEYKDEATPGGYRELPEFFRSGDHFCVEDRGYYPRSDCAQSPILRRSC